MKPFGRCARAANPAIRLVINSSANLRELCRCGHQALEIHALDSGVHLRTDKVLPLSAHICTDVIQQVRLGRYGSLHFIESGVEHAELGVPN